MYLLRAVQLAELLAHGSLWQHCQSMKDMRWLGVGTMVTTHPHMNAYWEDKNPKVTDIEVPMYVLMSYSTGLHTEGSFRGWKYSSSKEKW